MSEETTPQTTQLPPGAYDSKQSETNAAAIALLLLAAIAVALRFYTRFGIIKNASLGDICIGLALVCNQSYSAFV